MRFATFLLAFFGIPLIAEEAVSKVAFTESRHVIHAFSPSGEVTLPVVRVQMEIHYPGGKSQHGNVIVAHDPESGHYLWIYVPAHHPGDTASFLDAVESGGAAVYTAPVGLVLFNWPGALFVYEYTKKADNLDAAERASIEEIQRGLPVFERRGFHMDYKQVPVPFDTEFDCEPLSPICGPRIKKFVSISREGDNWRLVVRNRWDQEVILDSQFNLISTKRLPEQPRE